MGDGEAFRITNVNVFNSVAGRVDGPFDVTIDQGTITPVAPTSVAPAVPEEPGGGRIDGTGRRPSATPSCSPCPDRGTPTPGGSASWEREPSPT
jgi:hypothetical protein